MTELRSRIWFCTFLILAHSSPFMQPIPNPQDGDVYGEVTVASVAVVGHQSKWYWFNSPRIFGLFILRHVWDVCPFTVASGGFRSILTAPKMVCYRPISGSLGLRCLLQVGADNSLVCPLRRNSTRDLSKDGKLAFWLVYRVGVRRKREIDRNGIGLWFCKPGMLTSPGARKQWRSTLGIGAYSDSSVLCTL